MADYNEEIHNYDAHWKTIIGYLFEDFVQFFLPQIYHLIDFTKIPVSLEQELQKITKDDKKKGTIINDKLMKVFLKDGSSCWILIHIEIQSSKDELFPHRMYKYYYRIKDKHNHRKVAPIAIYTGKQIPTVNDHYVDAFGGGKLTYEFNTYMVKDAKDEELLVSKNPFALVVLASKYLNQSMNNNQLRLEFKLKLLTLAAERGYSSEQIDHLLTFIEFMLILPKDLKLKFENEVNTIFKKEPSMNYYTDQTDQSREIADRIYKRYHGISVEEIKQKAEREKQKAEREKRKAEREKQKAEREKQRTILKARQEKLASAKEFLMMGVPVDKVAQALRLPIDEVQVIQAGLK